MTGAHEVKAGITGMLWYFETHAAKDFDWQEATIAALEYYNNKYKRFPTVVRLNPADVESAGLKKIGNVRVVADKTIMQNHALVTEEGKQ